MEVKYSPMRANCQPGIYIDPVGFQSSAIILLGNASLLPFRSFTMREFFYPTSVAVIGVSEKPDNLGRNIIGNLVEFGFGGIVYPVGPSGGFIQTHRIYRSISEIPDPVDLAVILTPARTVPGLLEECGQKGVRWAIIEAAGFREYGEEGSRLEEQIVDVAHKYGIRFLGPNCVG